MNVSLTPKLEAFVRQKVESGLYNNASEVIREALRLLVEREKERPAGKPDKERIRAKLLALKRPLRKRGIVSLSLFGSVVRNEARPDSDIDVLVDIDPKRRFSLIDLASAKGFLEDELGRDVDVAIRKHLDPRIRSNVLGEAESVY